MGVAKVARSIPIPPRELVEALALPVSRPIVFALGWYPRIEDEEEWDKAA